MRPRALDLFCGAGGATKGLQRAGFHVTGVDIKPQPNYCGDEFFQADVRGLADQYLGKYTFIWASPPCQRHTQLRGLGKGSHLDLDMIPDTRALLHDAGVPYVIENVIGAPLRSPTTLCGSMFGLAVKRHRLFEVGWFGVHRFSAPECSCRGRRNIAVYGKAPGHRLPDGVIRARSLKHGSEAMGIGWMTWPELTQAIPPAYSEYIGRAALAAINRERP